MQAFLNDKSPTAFATVIDQLLASPAYGQRWGRHWLDVVRYADAFDLRSIKGDSIGAGDISEAWRYRDWVVNAFNRDLPYRPVHLSIRWPGTCCHLTAQSST